MWAVIKFDKKKINAFTTDLKAKLGQDLEIYIPKFNIQNFKNKKLISKELNLLGDYLFCFHKKLESKDTLNFIQFTRGLKYSLNGHKESQKEIAEFIFKCKNSENKDGFLSRDFLDLCINKKYKFSSGPFTNKIFEIINLQKNRIKIMMGNLSTTIKKKEFFFTPL